MYFGINMKSNNIGILIKKASLQLEKTALSVLAPYDMTLTQYKILAYLYEAPQGSTRQVDLERAFCMTNPSVTSVLHTLENKELICRSANPEDGRSKVISLTDKANTMRSELNEAGGKLENEFTKSLTQAERTTIIELLTKLSNKKGE